jgi:hypothetical protein
MAANDYIRTVNITPLGTSYSWDTPPSWITITRIGTTNDWTITIAANSGAPRNATLTVRHANTTTVDTISVSQNGVSVSPTATPSPTSSGGAGPTATPIVPTATPIPPTATSPAGAGYSLSFVDESFFIDDFTNGAGSYVDLVYNISGTTSAPVLVEKDSRISWTNRSGPSGGVGTLRIYSLMGASADPISVVLSPDFKISHPLNSSVVASIPGSITQAYDSRLVFVSPTSTPSPTSVPSGGGGGGGCLIAGTKITLADNSVVNIEELSIGLQLKSTIFGDMPNTDNVDELKAWNSQSPAISSTTTYLNSITSYIVDKVYNFNNGLLVSSKDHLHIVKVGDTWTTLETANVAVGNKVMTVTGEVEITSIEIDETPTTVYKLDVEPNDTYIANGVVTHNLKEVIIEPGAGDGGEIVR